jgi:uncharacterized membrane protein
MARARNGQPFQAAYTAPIILRNRQSAIDRDAAEHDYEVNLKAELEIELLHQKLDLLREEEIGRLITNHRAAGSPLVQ